MSNIIRWMTTGKLPAPTPEEIAALGGIGVPGSAANQQAAEQNAANDERYYDDVRSRNAETMRPGMSARDKVKQATANVDAAEFGPMDGSKPPAEAFLPASKSKAPPPSRTRGGLPTEEAMYGDYRNYEAFLRYKKQKAAERQSSQPQDSASQGQPAAPQEQKAAQIAAQAAQGTGGLGMDDASSRAQYEQYKQKERARAGRLKELGMMHENQETLLPYEEWLSSQGTSSGPVDMSEVTAAARAENREKFGENPNQSPEVQRRVAAGRRREYMNRMAKQFAQQIADGTTSLSEIMAAYDNGVAENLGKGMTAHNSGAAAARNITDPLSAGQLAQRQLNVDANWDEINEARKHRVPRGFVSAQRAINDAMLAGDDARAAAIAATYAQVYGPSFLAFSNATNARLGTEAEAAAQVAARQKPPEKSSFEQMQADREQINQMPAGPDRLSAMQFQARNMLGDNATPEAVDQHVQGRYQPMAQQLAAKPFDQWSPEERSEFGQVVSGMKYKDFLRYTNLTDDEYSQKLYQEISGEYANWDNWAGSWFGQDSLSGMFSS